MATVKHSQNVNRLPPYQTDGHASNQPCRRFNCRMIGRFDDLCLQCFDAVGWAAGRASGL